MKGQPIISPFMSSDYKTKIAPFYIQCIPPELKAMWDSGIYIPTKLQACGIFPRPILKKGSRKKKLNKHYNDVDCEFLHLCAAATATPTSSLPACFFPDKEPLGVQKNIWKLVAQRVTQHFIKQEAIPNHSPLSSFL